MIIVPSEAREVPHFLAIWALLSAPFAAAWLVYALSDWLDKRLDGEDLW